MLNYAALDKCIRYLIRPSRPQGLPKIRGIYIFEVADDRAHGRAMPPNSAEGFMLPSRRGVTDSVGAQLGALYVGSQRQRADVSIGAPTFSDHSIGEAKLSPIPTADWADLLEACENLIAFNVTICRHDRVRYGDPRPIIAMITLRGCQSCGTCPEGVAYPGESPQSHLPLLSPPPMHTHTVESAQRFDANGKQPSPTILRCRTCLRDRWCERCNAWWCEDCYSGPSRRPGQVMPASESQSTESVPMQRPSEGIKVHNGLCVSHCLVNELLTGGGEGGMWG